MLCHHPQNDISGIMVTSGWLGAASCGPVVRRDLGSWFLRVAFMVFTPYNWSFQGEVIRPERSAEWGRNHKTQEDREARDLVTSFEDEHSSREAAALRSLG